MANIREGARRMRSVGNLILLMAALASVSLWIVRNPLSLFAVPFVPLGALIWAAGWILDGFAE